MPFSGRKRWERERKGRQGLGDRERALAHTRATTIELRDTSAYESHSNIA
jgi:hypothetical protein